MGEWYGSTDFKYGVPSCHCVDCETLELSRYKELQVE